MSPRSPAKRSERPVLTIITAAYNESANLPTLHSRIQTALDKIGVPWEWILIDDHSSDDTYLAAAAIARRDPRLRAFRLARNSGAHKAALCGLHRARGECAVVMASDLQDPPEAIADLFAEWKKGNHVVWAVRSKREKEAFHTILFSRLFYFIMRKFAGMKTTPPTGADFFLLDRLVLRTLAQFNESNPNVIALITWMGFKQSQVLYVKAARLHGRSGWTLSKKINLLIDSITSFTYRPIRLISAVGVLVACAGFSQALRIVLYAVDGTPVPGWASLMVATLTLGGLQMVMMGVLGEYLWRALEQSRRRPIYFLEAATDASLDDAGEESRLTA